MGANGVSFMNELAFGDALYFLEQVNTADGPGWIWVRLADDVSSYPVAYQTKEAARRAAEEDALSLESEPITLTPEHFS